MLDGGVGRAMVNTVSSPPIMLSYSNPVGDTVPWFPPSSNLLFHVLHFVFMYDIYPFEP